MKKIIIIILSMILLCQCNVEQKPKEYYVYKLEIHYSNGDEEIINHTTYSKELGQWVLDNGTLCIYEYSRHYIVCDVRRWKILSKEKKNFNE
jgi:hypothetical protein